MVCCCAFMVRPMTIENANRMNTETMLFKIDILFPSVPRAFTKVFQAHVGINKWHLRILQPERWNGLLRTLREQLRRPLWRITRRLKKKVADLIPDVEE